MNFNLTAFEMTVPIPLSQLLRLSLSHACVMLSEISVRSQKDEILFKVPKLRVNSLDLWFSTC